MRRLIFLFTLILITSSVFGQANASKDWLLLDYATDSVPGVSVNKAYAELLKSRKSVPVIVAVIDGGVDYKHEDLKDVMWKNPGEIEGNGIDDDNNGYVDDIYGWNFIGGADGRNVNYDNLEVARLLKSLGYKYKTADPSKLNKKQKKEYELYQKVKKEVDENIANFVKKVDKYSTRKDEIVRYLDMVDSKMKEENLSFSQVDSIDVSTDTLMAKGVKLINRVKPYYPELNSVDSVKELFVKDLQGAIDYYSERINYHYNPDYNSRKIVGDNYEDSYERFYGNADVKGPDAFHGTHVSGTIAAKRNNGIGMDGIADNVKIMAVRVVPNGDERDKDVANGIRYAADNGADIINMSFGKNYKWDKRVVDKAVRYAEKKGVLLIHAAGNNAENNDEIEHYPTNKYEKKMWFCRKKAKSWMDIGANTYMNDSLFIAGFSNFGKKEVSVFAPGVAIYSTTPENKYASISGTSMATPVVAGVAAVLKSYFPGLKAKQIKDIIMESSDKKDLVVYVPGTKKEKFVPFSELSVSGGEVNLYNAVLMAIQKYSNKAAK